MKSLIRVAFLVLAASACATVAPPGDAGAAAQGKVHTVLIKGMAFVPARLEVAVGDTVEWVNQDVVPHTATASRNGAVLFDSDTLPSKAAWRYEVKEEAKGSVPYVCTLHPSMTGTLVVR